MRIKQRSERVWVRFFFVSNW